MSPGKDVEAAAGGGHASSVNAPPRTQPAFGRQPSPSPTGGEIRAVGGGSSSSSSGGGGGQVGQEQGVVGEGADLEELIDSYGYSWLHGALFAFLALAGLGPAKEMVTLSLLGPALACHFGVPAGFEGLLQVAAFGGSLLAAPFYGYLADCAGRKPAIAVACLAVALPSAATALAPSFSSAVALRFLVGLGLPFDPVMFTYYLEFLPGGHRGSQIVALTIVWMSGLALESALAWAAFTLTHDWRAFALASAAPAVLAALLVPLLPESPFFLESKGKDAKAHRVLSQMARAARKPPPPLPTAPPRGDVVPERGEEGPGCCASSVGLPLLGCCEVSRSLCSRAGRALKTVGFALFTAALAAATIGLVEISVLLHAATTAPPASLLTPTPVDQAMSPHPSSMNHPVSFHPAGSASLCSPSGGLTLGPMGWPQLLLTNFSGMSGVLLACVVIDCLGRRASLGVMLAFGALSSTAMLVPGLSLPGATALLSLARTAAHGGYPILAVFVGDLYAGHLRGAGESLAETTTSLAYMLAPLGVDALATRVGLAAAVAAIAATLWVGLIALLLTPGQPSAEELAEEEADRAE